ncbi:hypothetical protein GCM10022402_45560 [Salinactinospora qingdaonensis]|uniref:Uncharacterized protein n=1 Tax=Salinactinospora qingdaonensis TaxID=702744 RepID=A0ABP7GE03_9ACTN
MRRIGSEKNRPDGGKDGGSAAVEQHPERVNGPKISDNRAKPTAVPQGRREEGRNEPEYKPATCAPNRSKIRRARPRSLPLSRLTSLNDQEDSPANTNRTYSFTPGAARCDAARLYVTTGNETKPLDDASSVGWGGLPRRPFNRAEERPIEGRCPLGCGDRLALSTKVSAPAPLWPLGVPVANTLFRETAAVGREGLRVVNHS